MMRPSPARLRCSSRFAPALLCLAVLLLWAAPASAYIGPGAGFALISSAFVLVIIFFSVLFSILFWPVRALLGWIRGRKARRRARIKRLVILGLDGLDPEIASDLIEQGRLPHFSKLAERGCFKPLGTSLPPISPVAWSCFMTGCNPGRHSIYDFLARDPANYLPVLSSTKIGEVDRFLKIGKFRIPLGKPTIRLLRKSVPFWSLLGKQGVSSTVLRVPITFPPEKFNGQLLSGMCVPDILGTQGTYSLYTTEKIEDDKSTGGMTFGVEFKDGVVRGKLVGPPNPVTEEHEDLEIPFELRVGRQRAELRVEGQRVELKVGEYSPWIRLSFKPGLGIAIQGIARFLVTQIEPEIKLYVSPINIDPEKPAQPISHPYAYSVYLAKRAAPYATLGLAEDTWALNEGAIGDQAFLDQAYLNHGERELMWFDALDKRRHGVVACVFDTSDRIQHTFWRYRNEDHPAPTEEKIAAGEDPIERMYERMDDLVGRTMAKLGRGDELIVMSDHGFNDFSRGVNLNTWLHRNGYLTLKEGASGKREWFADVDWEKTRAYSLGLSCIFLNMAGRESRGIVQPGEEALALKKEIIDRLQGITDPERPDRAAVLNVWDRLDVYDGPYVRNAPDITIGFNAGWRTSWDSATGKLSDEVFEDNVKAWSGDHCLDPSVVPGVLFTSFEHSTEKPRIIDIAPTAISLLGGEAPAYMEGEPLAEIEIRKN